MNMLNQDSAPCADETHQMNVGQCIARGLEKKLNCAIPDMSSGDAVPPVGNLNTKLCSSEEEFSNFKESFRMSGYTEKTLYEQFGCVAVCQGKIYLEINSIHNSKMSDD